MAACTRQTLLIQTEHPFLHPPASPLELFLGVATKSHRRAGHTRVHEAQKHKPQRPTMKAVPAGAPADAQCTAWPGNQRRASPLAGRLVSARPAPAASAPYERQGQCTAWRGAAGGGDGPRFSAAACPSGPAPSGLNSLDVTRTTPSTGGGLAPPLPTSSAGGRSRSAAGAAGGRSLAAPRGASLGAGAPSAGIPPAPPLAPSSFAGEGDPAEGFDDAAGVSAPGGTALCAAMSKGSSSGRAAEGWEPTPRAPRGPSAEPSLPARPASPNPAPAASANGVLADAVAAPAGARRSPLSAPPAELSANAPAPGSALLPASTAGRAAASAGAGCAGAAVAAGSAATGPASLDTPEGSPRAPPLADHGPADRPDAGGADAPAPVACGDASSIDPNLQQIQQYACLLPTLKRLSVNMRITTCKSLSGEAHYRPALRRPSNYPKYNMKHCALNFFFNQSTYLLPYCNRKAVLQ